MKLVVLSDAKAMDGYGSEHGLSFLIEVDNQPTLFDTGASDVFLKNARILGMDLNGLDRVVLSHGHWDHGNGLQYLDNLPLVCHPGCFVRRYRKSGRENLGLALSKTKIEAKFDLRTSSEALKLSENLYFLGEIPRVNDFEARSTKYQLEDGQADFILDDSGLACITEKGLVVISGCAHSGICNMIEHARQVTGVYRVEAVLGGFHLSGLNVQARSTIQFLHDLGVHQVLPSHCTLEPALSTFRDRFKSQDLLVGSVRYF
jgi:7,8-dihydropterin-6-yl-methyl-4-(beta-D-ribofuranosyl)aminobenzene 5'-phosphate synthase